MTQFHHTTRPIRLRLSVKEGEDLSEVKERRKTYERTWPLSATQSALEMSKAGFLYTGISDLVFCFKCGIQLWQWCKNDNPMVQHQRMSPLCPFVISTNNKKTKKKKRKKDEAISELLDTLRTENHTLREEKKCLICLTYERSKTFIPCGHFVTCYCTTCDVKHCPICRVEITGCIKTYFS